MIGSTHDLSLGSWGSSPPARLAIDRAASGTDAPPLADSLGGASHRARRPSQERGVRVRGVGEEPRKRAQWREAPRGRPTERPTRPMRERSSSRTDLPLRVRRASCVLRAWGVGGPPSLAPSAPSAGGPNSPRRRRRRLAATWATRTTDATTTTRTTTSSRYSSHPKKACASSGGSPRNPSRAHRLPPSRRIREDERDRRARHLGGVWRLRAASRVRGEPTRAQEARNATDASLVPLEGPEASCERLATAVQHARGDRCRPARRWRGLVVARGPLSTENRRQG